MKKIVLFGAAAAALIATPTLAQQNRSDFGRGAGVTRAEVESRTRDQFARTDVNRDGYISQSEAQAVRGRAGGERRADRGQRAERREARSDRREQVFASLDRNRDGSISRSEFFAPRDRADRAERRALRGERRGQFAGRSGERQANRGLGFGGRSFELMDANRDGRVSLSEATAHRVRAFFRADANRDGRVTREERRALRDARQGQRI